MEGEEEEKGDEEKEEGDEEDEGKVVQHKRLGQIGLSGDGQKWKSLDSLDSM